MEDFYLNFPAIWLVFAGSYLNHQNAPTNTSDQREKNLIDLLRDYLQSEITHLSYSKQYNVQTLAQLSTLAQLLEL